MEPPLRAAVPRQPSALPRAALWLLASGLVMRGRRRHTAGTVKADLPARKSASFAGVTGTGSGETRLIILRGNSASGKSSTAAEIRRRHGRRDLAVVGQDNLRRDVLREHDVPAGVNIGLIDLVTRYALNHGFNVIIEGILIADHYAEMLMALINNHRAGPAATTSTCRSMRASGGTQG